MDSFEAENQVNLYYSVDSMLDLLCWLMMMKENVVLAVVLVVEELLGASMLALFEN
jgi:hypothetical protein